MTIEHLYTKKQAAQLRQKLIEEHIIPIVKVCFKKYPQLRSATFLVAQDFYNKARNKEDWTEDNINLPGFNESFLANIYRELDKEGYDYYWSDNWGAIPAFAAYCREGAHQCMPIAEAYTPYAVLRRNGDDIAIEIIGQMLRPWLDGIQPQG
jgi:hypothetical protein